jgi:hypothetical protein
MQEYLDSNSTCTHERSFDGDSTNVIAFGVCTGTDALDPAIHTVTVINTTNKGIYELYGQLSAPKLSFKQLGFKSEVHSLIGIEKVVSK